MRRALVVAALIVACALAGNARADGDPASDYLLATKVFLPFDMKVSKEKQGELIAFVEATNRSGYAIRVAVIGSSYDMGSVVSLWRKPRTYARFLAAELRFIYAKRLLIVMPNGFGVSWRGHAVGHEYAVLSKIPIGQSPAGLVDAAQAAVSKLAAAAGVEVAMPTAGPGGTGHRRALIVAAAIAALALALLVRVALRRRQRT
jgi:hypothetical protein